MTSFADVKKLMDDSSKTNTVAGLRSLFVNVTEILGNFIANQQILILQVQKQNNDILLQNQQILNRLEAKQFNTSICIFGVSVLCSTSGEIFRSIYLKFKISFFALCQGIYVFSQSAS